MERFSDPFEEIIAKWVETAKNPNCTIGGKNEVSDYFIHNLFLCYKTHTFIFKPSFLFFFIHGFLTFAVFVFVSALKLFCVAYTFTS